MYYGKQVTIQIGPEGPKFCLSKDTGCIGSQKQWEGFGIDYFLPSGTDEGGCYAETCGM